MKLSTTRALLGTALLLAAGLPLSASADEMFSATLKGVNEVPALVTTATGTFTATLNADASALDFVLTYDKLEGDPTAAHVHIGQVGVNGGVSFFFCGGGGKPACPPAPATITGTIVATDVIGPVGQGVNAGEFSKVVAMLRSGLTYANVHTTRFPGGAARGQVKPPIVILGPTPQN
jgi:hypothetical protein